MPEPPVFLYVIGRGEIYPPDFWRGFYQPQADLNKPKAYLLGGLLYPPLAGSGVCVAGSDTASIASSHFLPLPDFIDALRQRPALNDFLSIFQMRPLFPESETRWPLQFARDSIWMYGGCFLGCETSDGPPNHQSTRYIGGLRLSHLIEHKHM